MAASLVLILDAEARVLSGVFALAFLIVHMSFIVACVMLKLGRETIPRRSETSLTNMMYCLCMVSLRFLAIAFLDAKALLYFRVCVAVFFAVVFLMLARVSLLKALLSVPEKVMACFQSETARSQQSFGGRIVIAKAIEPIKNTPVGFFAKLRIC